MKTNFKIKTDGNGQPMVFDFNPDQVDNSDYAFNTNLVLQARIGIVVYLESDNVKCSGDLASLDIDEKCFNDVEGYANYLSAMLGKSEEMSEDWGIIRVGSHRAEDPSSDGKES